MCEQRFLYSARYFVILHEMIAYVNNLCFHLSNSDFWSVHTALIYVFAKRAIALSCLSKNVAAAFTHVQLFLAQAGYFSGSF